MRSHNRVFLEGLTATTITSATTTAANAIINCNTTTATNAIINANTTTATNAIINANTTNATKTLNTTIRNEKNGYSLLVMTHNKKRQEWEKSSD